MAAFSRQNWPAPADAGSIISAAVIFLAVAVVIVTTPAWALRQVVFENAIDYFDRVAHERIVRPSNAVSHQMKEIAAHNISRWVQAAAVGDLYHLCVGIGVRIRRIRIGWVNADVVAGETLPPNPPPRGGALFFLRPHTPRGRPKKKNPPPVCPPPPPPPAPERWAGAQPPTPKT